MTTATAERIFEYQREYESRRWRTMRRLLRKRVASVAIAYLLLFYVAGIFAPIIATHDPNEIHLSQDQIRQSPSLDHWLGTDHLGRDLYSRVVYAARTTILFTVAVIMTGGVFLGLGLGLLAGYKGGWVDAAIMRIGEVLAGLPTLLLMLAIAAAFRTRINSLSFWLQDHTFLGSEAGTLIKFLIVVGATVPFAWIGSSRVVRSQALAIRETDYILAAESVGATTWRIITRHVLPGVLPIFIVGLSGGMAAIAGAEVALSWLGLGIDPPGASFGSLIREAGPSPQSFRQTPHLLLVSATPVVLFFFAWNLLGDALVDLIEPRTSRR